MKKLLSLALLLFILCPTALRAQECMGAAIKEGSGYEMISYNAKGKETGRLVYKVKKVTKEGPDMVFLLEFQSLDTKGKSEMTNTMTMRCSGSELRVDASALMLPEQNKQFESFAMTFTSKDIVFPAKLTVGQTLPDASLHGEGMAGPMAVTNDMKITNRKVTGQETITVPAGTFDTFKVASDMTVTAKTVIKMSFDFSSVSYRSDKLLWDVKTETYRKGKLVGTTELSKLF